MPAESMQARSRIRSGTAPPPDPAAGLPTACFRVRASTRSPMLLDISPLCRYHNEPMNLTQQTLHPRRFLEENCHWFACPLHDCNQRYDTGRGYYVVRDGAVEDATNRQPCADCGLFLLYGEAWRNDGGYSLALRERRVSV